MDGSDLCMAGIVLRLQTFARRRACWGRALPATTLSLQSCCLSSSPLWRFFHRAALCSGRCSCEPCWTSTCQLKFNIFVNLQSQRVYEISQWCVFFQVSIMKCGLSGNFAVFGVHLYFIFKYFTWFASTTEY